VGSESVLSIVREIVEGIVLTTSDKVMSLVQKNVRTAAKGNNCVGIEDIEGSLESKRPSEVDNICLIVRRENSHGNIMYHSRHEKTHKTQHQSQFLV